jgi:hypothetical protein
MIHAAGPIGEGESGVSVAVHGGESCPGCASVAALHDEPMTRDASMKYRQVADTYAQNEDTGTCHAYRAIACKFHPYPVDNYH